MSDPLTIASNFLKSAPPGEFNEVFAGLCRRFHPLTRQDVKGVLGDQAGIFDEPGVTENAYRTYNTEQMVAVEAGDHKVSY